MNSSMLWGTDGTEAVSDYQESIAYSSNGKIREFHSTGAVEEIADAAERVSSNILDIEFFYREDGSLLCKKYNHNSFLFGSVYSSCELFFDKAERLVFSECYITHGSLEYYYIYKGNTNQPIYCFILDNNLGSFYPKMISAKTAKSREADLE